MIISHRIRKLFLAILLVGMAVTQSGSTFDTLTLLASISYFESTSEASRARAAEYYKNDALWEGFDY